MIVARKSCPHPTAARAIDKVTPDANFIILIPKSPLQFWKTEMIIHKVPPGSYTRWHPVSDPQGALRQDGSPLSWNKFGARREADGSCNRLGMTKGIDRRALLC